MLSRLQTDLVNQLLETVQKEQKVSCYTIDCKHHNTCDCTCKLDTVKIAKGECLHAEKESKPQHSAQNYW